MAEFGGVGLEVMGGFGLQIVFLGSTSSDVFEELYDLMQDRFDALLGTFWI